MADNSNDRKKTLIISMFIFLLCGGGIFLFFIIQGSNDLTGAGKSNFQYGSATRGAVSSFFKVLGFNDNETMSVGPEKRPVPKSFLDEVAALPEAGSKADDSLDSWGGVKPAPSASRSVVPKMGGRSMSSVGGGGGSSQSSGGVSRFGDGSGSGNTHISAKTGAGGDAAIGKGTLGSLQKANALLGSGLRSGSAMTAKSSWDRSFGVNSAGSGRSDLAYAKTGLVKLDTIKKGEVESLKTTDMKSLKTPEPGAFKEDKEMEAKDATLNKAKEDAADAIKKAAAQAALEAASKSLTGTANEKAAPTRNGGGDSKNEEVPGLGNDGSCNAADGPQTSLCSKALSSAFPGENVSYTKMGNNVDGTLVQVSYAGEGHTQDAVVLMGKDGSVKFNWGDFKAK